jgi:hypothetical protein
VARRIFDSLTPGWRQIGAVWLPLPHLLQAGPVQIDYFYRSGAFGSLLSIACLATTVWAYARLVIAATGSQTGAAVTALLLVANPNLLYLHVTPMTEPLLLATCALALLWTWEWISGDRGPGIGDPGKIPLKLTVVLAAAVWTRYEAWAIIGALLLAAGHILWQRGIAVATLARRLAVLAAWPLAAIALFLLNGKASTGHWFVSGGFYVHDPRYEGHGLEDAIAVWWGTGQIGGFAVEAVAILAIVLLVRARDPHWPLWLVPLAAAALPLYALFEGHPYRVRYMVPTAVACALLCGRAASMTRRKALTAGLVIAALIELPPWSQRAAFLVEAQWDVPASVERRPVRDCLARGYRGEKVLASMGSLAHVMQELSHEGFAIADFIHEGNGRVWELALETGPAGYAGWMLVEEQSEGGDALAARIRADAAFASRMRRVCEGGGVALYRRADSQ